MLTEGIYLIKNSQTDRALDSNADQPDLGQVYTGELNRGQYQKWYVKPVDSSHFWIVDLATGLQLDSGSGVYTKQHREPDNNQTWKLQQSKDGAYQLTNAATLLALEESKANKQDVLTSHPDAENPYQRWKFTRIDPWISYTGA